MVRQELLSAAELTHQFMADQAAARFELHAMDCSLQESRRQLRATAGALSSALEANVGLRAGLGRELGRERGATRAGCERLEDVSAGCERFPLRS